MATTVENISCRKPSEKPSQPEGVAAWVHAHPTTIKILKIATLLLGLGLLLSLPWVAPIYGMALTLTLGIAGGLLVLAASIGLLFAPLFGTPVAAAQADTAAERVSLVPTFCAIDSSQLKTIEASGAIRWREDFVQAGIVSPPPVIGKSPFVSKEQAEHLMRNKKGSALAVKYEAGDAITHMEGALHTFVTALCSVLRTGDDLWLGSAGGLQKGAFGSNQMREIILSTAIHPDFEFDTVMMPVVRAQKEAVIGAPLENTYIPTAQEKQNSAFRHQYDENLLKHMVYHLSPDHRIPALREIGEEQIMGVEQAVNYLAECTATSQEGRPLQNLFMRVFSPSTREEYVVSLEILLHSYVEQLRNEFKVLNPATPQGYVYTINPPSIFARFMGEDATILNRLQALAFQSLLKEGLFSNMHTLAFSDYADKGMIPLLEKVFADTNVRITRQTDLMHKDRYALPSGLALVLHNNSDAFGQNIETEGPSSLDGVIGTFSNAASVLKRDRPDLVDHIV